MHLQSPTRPQVSVGRRLTAARMRVAPPRQEGAGLPKMSNSISEPPLAPGTLMKFRQSRVTAPIRGGGAPPSAGAAAPVAGKRKAASEASSSDLSTAAV
jgi:hypothetical protein